MSIDEVSQCTSPRQLKIWIKYWELRAGDHELVHWHLMQLCQEIRNLSILVASIGANLAGKSFKDKVPELKKFRLQMVPEDKAKTAAAKDSSKTAKKSLSDTEHLKKELADPLSKTSQMLAVAKATAMARMGLDPNVKPIPWTPE